MPIYEYECENCNKVTEAWQNISDEPLTSCPDCNGTLKKLISSSSFRLKGGGWYADGYSTSKPGSCSGGACSSSDSSSSSSAPAAPSNGCGKESSSCPCAA